MHQHQILDGRERFSRDHSMKCRYLQSELDGVEKPAETIRRPFAFHEMVLENLLRPSKRCN